MIWFENWLSAVVQLFDHTLRTLMGESFFSLLLEVLLLLVGFAMMQTFIRAGRGRK